MKRICVLLLLFLIAPVCSHSQFVGYTSPQGVVAQPFNAVTATGPSAVIQNLGQTVHFLSYKITGGTPSMIQIRLEGSYDNSTFFAISDDATDLSQGEVLAVGYFPYIRANLILCTGCGAGISLTANYSGVSASPANPLGFYNPSQTIRKVVFTNVSAGAGQVANGIDAPYGSPAGILVIVSSGNFPASSQVNLTSHTGGNTIAIGGQTLTTPITGNIQTLIWPVGPPATTIDVNYSSGGASATTFSAYYYFFPPGSSLPATAQPATPINQQVTGLNATATVNLTPGNGQYAYLYSLSARCSAGTAGLTVIDGATTVWTSGTAEVGTTTFRYQWNPGLRGVLPSNGGLSVSLSTCGVGNTGTLDVQGSVF